MKIWYILGNVNFFALLLLFRYQLKGNVYDGSKIIVKLKFPQLLYSIPSKAKETEPLKRKRKFIQRNGKDKARKD